MKIIAVIIYILEISFVSSLTNVFPDIRHNSLIAHATIYRQQKLAFIIEKHVVSRL